MQKVLDRSFFERPALYVARGLIGKYLVRDFGDSQATGQIIETEAYIGSEDLACHASHGRTKRTEVMYGPGGVFYVYFTYGMYWMLNVITGMEGHPQAVLIRGLDFVSGPGRLTKALKVDKQFYGRKAEPETGLWFEDRGVIIDADGIKVTPRIGVNYAGVWAKKPFRFVLTDPRK